MAGYASDHECAMPAHLPAGHRRPPMNLSSLHLSPTRPAPRRLVALQRAELERVKAERASLLASLAKLRGDAGKSGGELQQEDIRALRRELEAKKEKLNELRRSTHTLEEGCVALGAEWAGRRAALVLMCHAPCSPCPPTNTAPLPPTSPPLRRSMEQLETTSRDCDALMPAAEGALQARLATLTSELAGVDGDIIEAEAKHELYKLLELRTRWVAGGSVSGLLKQRARTGKGKLKAR